MQLQLAIHCTFIAFVVVYKIHAPSHSSDLFFVFLLFFSSSFSSTFVCATMCATCACNTQCASIGCARSRFFRHISASLKVPPICWHTNNKATTTTPVNSCHNWAVVGSSKKCSHSKGWVRKSAMNAKVVVVVVVALVFIAYEVWHWCICLNVNKAVHECVSISFSFAFVDFRG